MADLVAANKPPIQAKTRKEKRTFLKKLKRKQRRKEAAIKYREEEEARLNDPEEQLRIKLKEQEEAEITERGRREFEERERLWIEAANKRKEEEEEKRKKILEDSERQKVETVAELEEDDELDYVEDGPPEIIWQGNEIIIKKKVKVAKRSVDNEPENENVDRPTSNPLPPQSVAFGSYNKRLIQEILDDVAQQVPNFGTEQDKAHCPFHLKTGACRFGTRCSRVHFYPDKSCTLLIKNMYNGPGLAWEQDEGLEYTDEEVELSYEEFYEDVHTELMKFGELINFKVCRNGSYHLRGNVYAHYKSLESSILAYNTMNGRYFAGKQLTCEFVSVTKWKIAICGEYMKTRLKTCSRGTACNFIHCFRNPGGDYEWADWDNPPPNYWVRRMADFYGHSNQSSYDKKMELESFKSTKDSNRKRTPIYSRRHDSRRITPYEELEDRGKSRDRHSSNKSDQSSRRKETSFAYKHENLDDSHKTKRRNYSHDEGMRKEKDREITEKHKTGEEKSSYESCRRHKRSSRRNDEIDKFESYERCKRSRRKDEISTHKHDKSESKYRSKSSRYLKGDVRERIGDRSNDSSSHSSEEYHLSKNSIDAHDRYDGRYCSSNSDSDRDYNNTNKFRYNDKHSYVE